MCGIFGLAGSGFDYPRREADARLLHHRGPDGFGAHEDRKRQVYMAHCRLAVIDLSERAAQPMCNEDGTVWLTYNGEIYGFADLRRDLQARGHRFASTSDTEIIIHAYEEWGIDCLDRLNGMFAFALWDSVRCQLFLARDRLGIKPLYYGKFGDTLAFASDTRALIDLPFAPSRSLDPSALCCYLLYTYVSGAASIWRGISRLLPGHYLEYDTRTGSSSLHRYWQVPLEQRRWTAEGALERFGELFQQSVEACLVSDVPVGVFLSGGLDSASVASAAAGVSPNINTFSIGFEGWEHDERAAAADTARRLATTHHEDVLGMEHLADITRIVDAFDEPLADNSIFPTYLVSDFASRRVTVALSGDGGDELLSGYTWYGHTVDATPQKRLAFVLEPLVRGLGLRETAWGKRCSAVDHYRMLTSPTFGLADISRLFPGLSGDDLPAEEAYLYRSHLRPELSGRRQWQYVDLHTYLCDNNLMKVDRASTAHSIEVRVPFLDHRLVEFAFSLPEALVARRGTTKVVLRHWLENRGLSQVLQRPKQGFSFPVNRYWPVEGMTQTVRDGWLASNGLIDPKALQRLCAGAEGLGTKLWVLAVLEKWARRWLA